MPNNDSTRARAFAVSILAYTLIVLAVDSLATRGVLWPFDWRALYWLQIHDTGHGVAAPGADYFKLIFWLIVPVILCARSFDKSWFSLKLERTIDRYIIGGLAIVGMSAVLLVPLVPALRSMYPSMGALPAEAKPVLAMHYATWYATWLIGWEFLHRYAIPRAVVSAWPRYAVLICIVVMPVLEGGYHVAQGKHWLECLGMAAFSLVLTAWAVLRKNAIYQFLTHLAIEVALVALMLLV